MSLGRPNINVVIDKDTYARNQEFIRQAEERLRVFKEMNEQGMLKHEREMQLLELQKKVKEGEEARRLLESLSTSRPQITAPPVASPIVEPTSNTTRIEELGVHQQPTFSTYSAQTHVQSYPNVTYLSAASQSATGSGGTANTQTVYPPTVGPSYDTNNYLNHPNYLHPQPGISNVSQYSYGSTSYHRNNLHAGNSTVSYEDLATIQNARNWVPFQEQQARNIHIAHNQAQASSAQSVPSPVYVQAAQSNPPPPPKTNIADASNIVAMISIPDLEMLYKKTLLWVQGVPNASYCEIPHSNCVVYKDENGKIYVQTPPINGSPQELRIDYFFDRWKGMIETAQHMQATQDRSGPSQKPTHIPHVNLPISVPRVQKVAAVNQPVASSSKVDNSQSRTQAKTSEQQLYNVLHQQQQQQPQSQRQQQPHPQKLPQPHPPRLPQTQPHQSQTQTNQFQTHEVQPPHQAHQPPPAQPRQPQPQPQPQSQPQPPQPQPSQTQPQHQPASHTLSKSVAQVQIQLDSRSQNSTEHGTWPSTSARDPHTSREGSHSSLDIVPVTFFKRRAPGDADKKRLAKDLLFALGKRVRPDVPTNEPSERSSKKHATEPPVQNSLSGMTSILNLKVPNVTPRASVGATMPPRPNLAQPVGSSFSSFSIAPSVVFQPYGVSTPLPPAVFVPARTAQYAHPVTNIPVISPPVAAPQAGTSEAIRMPNTALSTPETGQSVASSSSVGATSSSSKKEPHFPTLGQNPYPVLLTATNTAGPTASPPITVPQRSSDKTSTLSLLTLPASTPTVVNRGKATSAGRSTVPLATQPIASSSTSTFQGAIEQRSVPLFLPSTSDEEEEENSEVETIEHAKPVKTRVGRKVVNRAYVLIPPPSAKFQRLMRRKQVPANIRPTSNMVASETESEEDFSVPLEHINVIDKAAQDAIRLSASRIEVLPCKWDGCDVVTNCAQTLINHLDKAHRSRNSHFTCLWTQCGRRCHQSENHLERHASIPHRCAYKDCSETFRSGSSLLKHFRRHHKSGELKPSTRPVAMGMKSLPKVPTGELPAYLCLSRVAQPTPLTSKQHASLGPWVLRNINESDTSQTWQKKKTSRHESTPGGNPGADYEFLITRTLRPSSYLSEPAHVEMADIGMNSEFYEGPQYNESLTVFSRARAGNDVVELNSPNSPLFAPKPRMMERRIDLESQEVVEVVQNHDEGKRGGDAD